MSKEETLKAQTCVLKVSIHCEGCKRKVSKILKKIDGVFTHDIDAEHGKVTITGNVSTELLIRKLTKAGKHAELWASPKPANEGKATKEAHAHDNLKQGGEGKAPKGNNGGQPPQQAKPEMVPNLANLTPQQMQQLQQMHRMQQMQQMQQLQQMQKMKGFPQGKVPQHPSQMQMQMPPNQKSVKFDLPPNDDSEFSDDMLTDDDDFTDDEDDDGENFMEPPPIKKKEPGNEAANEVIQAKLRQLQLQSQQQGAVNPEVLKACKLALAQKNGGNGNGGPSPVAEGKGKKGGGGGKNGNQKGGNNKNEGASNGNGKGNGGGNNGKKGNGGGGNVIEMAMNGGKNGNPGGGNGGPQQGHRGGMNFPMGNNPGNGPHGGHGLSLGFQGGGPEMMTGNPYQQHQQQYLTAVMNQQQAMGNERFQPMMYARPPPAINYAPQHPYPYPNHPYGQQYPNYGPDPYGSYYFNDENPTGCHVM